MMNRQLVAGEREGLNRIAMLGIGIVSAVVLLLLFWLLYFRDPGHVGPGTQALVAAMPAFNACCNAVSAAFVTAGLVCIYRGQRRAHGVLMACAVLASALFLAGYVTYHSLHGDTHFVRADWIRPVYLVILASHIILSMLVVPLLLSTLYLASRARWSAHRRFARWTYPIWLYVSVTGVVVFFMLRYLNMGG